MDNTRTYFCIILFSICRGEFIDVRVDTPAGAFIGFKGNVTIDGAQIELSKFFGIPYAEPPIGNLRFAKTVSKKRLTQPLNVREHGHECIQITAAGTSGLLTSEDCLFLNIYAPEKEQIQDNLAVMIFIHGGGYVTGSANIYRSDFLAARGRVIVVTINYRLSVLGFLNVGNGPSNFGLWDQRLAIKWVHDNIRAFGGDNGRITLFGESAGASSVVFQAIFPGNHGLFQRIIAQSGTASAVWAETRKAKEEAIKFASLVGCTDHGEKTLLYCLGNVSASVINATLNDFSNGMNSSPFPFIPSIDNEFLTVSPKSLFNKQIGDSNIWQTSLAGLDIIIGVNSGEGIVGISPELGVEGNPADFLPNRTYFEDRLVPLCAAYMFDKSMSRSIQEMMINVYTTWENPDNQEIIRQNFMDMYGDGQFLAPMVHTINFFTQVSSIDAYMYYFTATPSNPLVPYIPWIDRPIHGEELPYVFGTLDVFNPYNLVGEFQEWERSLSNTIITMWSNFAKSGNPNKPNNVSVTWLPYSQSHHRYIEFGKSLNETVTKDRLFERRTHLWNTVLPTISEEMQVLNDCELSSSGEAGINRAGINMFAMLGPMVLLTTVLISELMSIY